MQFHDDVLRLRRLVEDLGTLADADAATTGPALRREQCDLAEIAAVVADAMTPLIDASHHQLQHSFESVVVGGDPARLAQIVSNLVTNAVKFTPPGGHLDLHVYPDAERSLAVVSVSDDGLGICKADRAHVFERFYRAESTRAVAGNGVGLAVVKQLVTAHHGTVEIADTAGGTTVVVTIPQSAR